MPLDKNLSNLFLEVSSRAALSSHYLVGKKNKIVQKTFVGADGTVKTMDVELFTWEKLDYVEKVKTAFNI